MSKPTDLNPLNPRNIMEVNSRPLQPGTGDTLVRTAVVGGPEKGGDRRVYLSVKLLAQLLDCARSSNMQRVIVDRAGVRVDLYRAAGGHEYEVWTLIGANPRPEPIPDFVKAASGGR